MSEYCKYKRMTLNKCKQRQTCGLFVWTYLKKKKNWSLQGNLLSVPLLTWDLSSLFFVVTSPIGLFAVTSPPHQLWDSQCSWACQCDRRTREEQNGKISPSGVRFASPRCLCMEVRLCWELLGYNCSYILLSLWPGLDLRVCSSVLKWHRWLWRTPRTQKSCDS